MTLEVSAYAMPSEVDDDFRALVDLRNAVEAEAVGGDVLDMTADELLVVFASNARRLRPQLVARLDGVLVGRAIVTLNRGVGTREASVHVQVHADHRGRGIGTALLARCEQVARDAGRTHLHVQVPHRVLDGPQVWAPTGAGSVPADDPGVRFLRRHDFQLRQVSRISLLEVAEGVASEVADGYRVHTWSGPTSTAWLRDLASLKTTMETATPAGDLTRSGMTWTSADVRDRDAELVGADRLMLTAAAEHVDSGRLVALTEIEVPTDHRPAVQEDTLVLPEHRGRGLGLALKAANLEVLRREHPDVTRVVTFNAEENRPMLDVNERLGFRPIGFEGVWEKRLRPR